MKHENKSTDTEMLTDEKLFSKKVFNTRWKKLLVALSCIVVFCTVYALILPAITLEMNKRSSDEKMTNVQYICGKSEHTHSIDCYNEKGVLICSIAQHKHTKDCIRIVEEDSTEEETVTRKTFNSRPIFKVPSPRGAIDFTNYIATVVVERLDDSGHWTDVTNGGFVSEDDTIRFRVEYQLPGHTLSLQDEEIVCTIPGEISLTAGDTGKVHNIAGEEIGDYIINADGHIQIDFYDEFASLNAAGNVVDGYVTFECAVENIQKDEHGEIHINFGGVALNLHTDEEDNPENDLRISKTGTVVDSVNGIAQYTIRIDSRHGTSTPPTFIDEMFDKMTYLDSLTVRSKNGNNVTSSCTISGNSTGSDKLNVTLPDCLGENDYYTITYRSKLDHLVDGSEIVDNRVRGSATGTHSEPLDDETNCHVTFENTMLEKGGTVNSDNTVDWTIHVNGERLDISGWTLTDEAVERNILSNIVLTDSEGNSRNITMPYTFPANSHDTYTVTYKTKFYQGIGEAGMTNHASLTPPNSDDGIDVVGTASIPGGQGNTFEKSLTDVARDGSTASITWTVDLNAAASDVPAVWEYTDDLDNDEEHPNSHFLTSSQKQALRQAVSTALSPYFTSSDYTLTVTDTSFDLVVRKDLPAGAHITFTYVSTANIENLKESQTFVNKGTLLADNREITFEPKYEYKPIVRKIDYGVNTRDATEHEYYESNATLKWEVDVSLLESLHGDVTVIDTLPDGISLKELSFYCFEEKGGADGKDIEIGWDYLRDSSGNYIKDAQGGYVKGAVPLSFTFENGVGTCSFVYNNKNYTLTARVNGQDVTITIDGDTVGDFANKTFRFVVAGHINNIPAGTMVDTYTNTVEVRDNNNKVDEDTHTQTVSANPLHNALSKSSPLMDETQFDDVDPSHGTISKYVTEVPYVITVNPNGDDLLEGSDTLMLYDEMTYYSKIDDHPVDLFLKEGSVHVYHRLPDGTKGEELNKFNLAITPSSSISGQYHSNTLTISLPDETPLIVEYTYLVKGDEGHRFVVDNTANIIGTSSSDSGTEFEIKVRVKKSTAQADARDIVIFKVDSVNLDYGLSGAKFDLYKYNSSSGTYEIVTRDITTDAHGIAVISNNIYNTAYKLIETKAPDGYKIGANNEVLFYIQDPDDFEKYEMPAHFTGRSYLSGAVLRYPNVSEATEIKVDKLWKDKYGNDVERDGSVSFDLYRKIVAGEVPTTEPVTVPQETTQPSVIPGSDNSTVSFDLHGRYSSDSFYSNQFVFPTNSVVHFTIRQTKYNMTEPNIPEIHVNGQIITDVTHTPIVPAEGDHNFSTDITFTFNLIGDTEITANINPMSEFTFVSVEYEEGETTTQPTTQPTTAPPTTTTTVEHTTQTHFDDELVGRYTITSSNSWTYTVKNLPSYFTDEDGNVYTYKYYVRESGTNNVSYLNNDGIVGGTITITNVVESSLVLPATGSMGTVFLYCLGSSMLIVCAVLAVRIRKRRNTADE